MNCRDMPPEAWARALNKLIFYFSRRHGVENAADLAQQTLLAVLQRPDFEFEKEEDFQAVCYGFANRVGLAASRRREKTATVPFDATVPDPESFQGPEAPECAVFLDEVRKAGEQLEERDWELIQKAAAAQIEGDAYAFAPEEANSLRVRLHRARRKLAKITGWRGR